MLPLWVLLRFTRMRAAPMTSKRRWMAAMSLGVCFNKLYLYFIMVGAVRFELTAPCSQSRCATRLRHAPNYVYY
jgi:hypothetical protein